jgi:hypothetical protein
MTGEHIIFGGKLTQGDSGLNLIHAPGAGVYTSFAGRATPHFFLVYLSQTESCLADELTHTELPNPVPGTDRITQSALVTVFERIATFLFYNFNDFFFGGYGLHDITCPFISV